MDMADSIHPDTRMGPVHLTVADLERSLAFYQDVLGLVVHGPGAGTAEPHAETGGDSSNTARLGAGREDLVVLVERRGARLPLGTSGLYHYALLVPSREEFARALRRIAEAGAPVQGIVDHWISEAIYLPDPDGNGIEIARDRPREAWPPMEALAALGNGPVDVDGLMAELGPEGRSRPMVDAETAIGHIHLHVGNLEEAERFYREGLGFDLMARYGPQASFLSAGGYHHHIGLNTWAGVGVPRPPPDAVGLRHFTVQVPNRSELERVVARVRRMGHTPQEGGGGWLVKDPSGNELVLMAQAAEPAGEMRRAGDEVEG